MDIHLYVYYKLADADRAAALAPARRVVAAGQPLCARTALLTRPGLDGGVATWMEVYENVRDLPALESALAAAVGDNRLDRYLAGPRRAEVFQDLPAEA